MEIQAQYVRPRREFGRQAGRGWAEPPAEILLDARPDPSAAALLKPAPRDPCSAAVQCSPLMAAHAANTVAVTFAHRGAAHVEGGWPRDVDASEPEQTQRCRRKLERDSDVCRAAAAAGAAASWAAGESEPLNPYADPLALLGKGGSAGLAELLQTAARAQRQRDLLKEQRAALRQQRDQQLQQHKEGAVMVGGGAERGGGGGGAAQDDDAGDNNSPRAAARAAPATSSAVRQGGGAPAAAAAASEVPSMYVATLLRDPWAAAAAAANGGGKASSSLSSSATSAPLRRPRRAVAHVAWHQPQQQAQHLAPSSSGGGGAQQAAAPTMASARRVAVCYSEPGGGSGSAGGGVGGSGSNPFASSSSSSSSSSSAALSSYVWDVATPYSPIAQLCPLPGAGGGLQCSAFAPRDHSLVACGQANGQAVLFDLRRGPHPFDSTPVASAHRDSVCAVLWIAGRGAGAAGELVTASSDGTVAWWDIRKLAAPLDALPLPWPAGGGGLAVAGVAAAEGASGAGVAGGGAGAGASMAGSSGGFGASMAGGGFSPGGLLSASGGGGGVAVPGPAVATTTPTTTVTPTLSAVLLDDTAATQPGRVLVGTREGAVALCGRRARTPADRVAAVYAAHAGPVTALQRSPHHPRFFVSAGDWSAKVWAEDHPRAPLLATAPSWRGPGATDSYVSAGAWSQTRPSVVYTAGMDGNLAAWDLLHSHAEPVAVLGRCLDAPLTALAAHAAGGALAVGGECGSVAVVALGPALAAPGAGERAEVGALLEREVARERALERGAKEQRQRQRQAAARRAAEVAAAATAGAAGGAGAASRCNNDDADDAELRVVEEEFAQMTGVDLRGITPIRRIRRR
jgi:hypothetical protein